MKKLLILAAVLVTPGLVLAQGGVYFNTFKGKDNANNLPAVNTPVYVGYVTSATKAAGATYDIGVFIGAAANLGPGTAQTTPGAVGTVVANGAGATQGQSGGANVVKNFLTGAGAGYTAVAGNVQFPGASVGTSVSVQLRAWSANLGSDWTTALAAWQTHPGDPAYVMGVSAPVSITLGDISLPKVPRLGNDGVSDAAFSTSAPIGAFAMVTYAPEPSVLALAGLGLVGAFMVRRRK